MAFRELALDGGLAQGEPVHGVVEVVGGGVAEVEQGGEGGAAGGAEFALDAQLGAGAEQAGDDHGEGEAEQVDEVLGEGGEVGEGAFFDLAVFPVGFAEEVAGGLAGVGGGDVHYMTNKRRRGNELN